MEKNVAILMADLSGYTALTETHGSSSAADLIDKYIEIVEDCLVADCRLQERTGDQVMILSQSPDSLLSTAVLILQNASKQNHFLQIHGGLHYGETLKRKESYFGAAINLTARIAAKANPGTFWCSPDFVAALKNKIVVKLQSKGRHNFKNITEEKEIFEVTNNPGRPVAIDPICRMLIVNSENAIKHPEMEHVRFCSATCLAIFQSNQGAGLPVHLHD